MTQSIKSTLLDYAKAQAVGAGATRGAGATPGMKHAVIVYALVVANGYLPAGHPSKIDPAAARKQLKADLAAMKEKTAEAVSAVFPKLAQFLIKRHGKPGSADPNGNTAFWEILTMEPSDAVALTVSDLRRAGWDDTWHGLRKVIGLKTESRTPLQMFLAELRSAARKVTCSDQTLPTIAAKDFNDDTLADFDQTLSMLIAFRRSIDGKG